MAGQPQAPVATGEFEWRCLTCGKTAPPTRGAYMGLLKHKCSGQKEIWLVDKGRGERGRGEESSDRGNRGSSDRGGLSPSNRDFPRND